VYDVLELDLIRGYWADVS